MFPLGKSRLGVPAWLASRLMTALMLLTAVSAMAPALGTSVLQLSAAESAGLYSATLVLFYGATLAIALVITVWRGHLLVAQLRRSVLLLVAIGSLVVSVLLGGHGLRPMMVVAPVLSLFLFHVLRDGKPEADISMTAATLFVATAAPLLILLFWGNVFTAYTSESFRGYFSSRSDYSYFAGLTILLLLTARPRWLWIALPFVATGFALSVSRTAIVSLTASVTFFAIIDALKRRALSTLLVGAALLIWVGLAPYVIDIEGQRLITLFQSPITPSTTMKAPLFDQRNPRVGMIVTSIEMIRGSLLFGRGDFYQGISDGRGGTTEPHNSVLQSILNFGLLTTALWLALIAIMFLEVAPAGKTILVFWFVFGLALPGYDAFLLTPASLLALFMAALVPRDGGVSWPAFKAWRS